MEILKFIVIEKIMKFFSLIITFSSLVFSQIIYIGPNSNTTQNGTLINPFTTIDKAMNATLNNSLYQNLTFMLKKNNNNFRCISAIISAETFPLVP